MNVLFKRPAFLLCGLAILSLVGCTRGCTSKTTSRSTDTLVYCSEGSPDSLSPPYTSTLTGGNVASQIYNRLVEFEKGGAKVVPALAKSWEISADKKQYTFQLRDDVWFHTVNNFTPTRPMNADDVLFSINRQRVPTHPYYNVGGGQYYFMEATGLNGLITNVVRVGDHTVRIELARVDATFLANIAMQFISIMSKEYADQLAEQGDEHKIKIDTEPIGTGPFILTRYDKDQAVRFQANERYWGEAPKLKNLVFAITPEPSVRTQKLLAGECHFVNEVAPEDLQTLRNNSDINVVEGLGFNVGYLAFNTQKKPFDDVRVRKAIHHALNRNAYISAVYLGRAEVAKNPIPPSISFGYNESVQDYEYSPEKAKALLAEAGLPNGFVADLWTLPVSRPYNPNGKLLGEMMQADLKAVGIVANLKTFDWATYLQKAKDGEHEMIQGGWNGDNGDPDNFLYVLLGCHAVRDSNFARFCHKPFNDLLVSAKATTDVQERTRLYRQAQVVFKEQAPWVTLAHSKVFRAMQKNVNGYKMDPLVGRDFFGDVALSP